MENIIAAGPPIENQTASEEEIKEYDRRREKDTFPQAILRAQRFVRLAKEKVRFDFRIPVLLPDPSTERLAVVVIDSMLQSDDRPIHFDPVPMTFVAINRSFAPVEYRPRRINAAA